METVCGNGGEGRKKGRGERKGSKNWTVEKECKSIGRYSFLKTSMFNKPIILWSFAMTCFIW